MRTIPLSKGLFAAVDDDDYSVLAATRWHAVEPSPGIYYAMGRPFGDDRRVYMHRFLMQAKKGLEVDHRDGNGLNNQRTNLRVCTRSQNAMNQRKNPKRLSGFKGVSISSDRKKWVAQICINQQRTPLGTFNTEYEAALAYNDAAIRLFGDFAKLNIL